MTLAQALKEKNRLASSIKELTDIIKTNNLNSKEASCVVDLVKVHKELLDATSKLIDIKAKIHIANAPVAHQIYELSETKSVIALYKAIPSKEGRSRFSSDDIQIAQFKTDTLLEMSKTVQSRIDALQDELDTFNAKTLIE